MQEASAALLFEKAARLRDDVTALASYIEGLHSADAGGATTAAK